MLKSECCLKYTIESTSIKQYTEYISISVFKSEQPPYVCIRTLYLRSHGATDAVSPSAYTILPSVISGLSGADDGNHAIKPLRA